jgi:hypothetical protein
MVPAAWQDVRDDADAKAQICMNPALANGTFTKAVDQLQAWLQVLITHKTYLVNCNLAEDADLMVERLRRATQDSLASTESTVPFALPLDPSVIRRITSTPLQHATLITTV